MSTTIYGIKNCDTIKKALKWLDANNVEYTFHDYRVDGLDSTLLDSLCKISDVEQMLNKRSTSYRALTDEQKADTTPAALKALFLATPTLIKRPLLVKGSDALLGFKDAQYQAFFE
ncbi:MAG: arsenate reductase [Gammaproteobacteria bacterium MedPE]|nr:MAG: arsenate reductase [Gammaproteobacteria bacterium MedPE]